MPHGLAADPPLSVQVVLTLSKLHRLHSTHIDNRRRKRPATRFMDKHGEIRSRQETDSLMLTTDAHLNKSQLSVRIIFLNRCPLRHNREAVKRAAPRGSTFSF
ncbi:hypothetical protein IAQ61_007243, partial [Plenodomus lingam]|uniref:uncharacterized protein n=1 Tax=Leptosphaeria maculans TaxID=5022 RepID=UPI00332BFE3B